MNGPLVALETLDGKSQHQVPGSRALVPQGVVHEGDCCHIHMYMYGPGAQGLAEVGCKQCHSFFQLEGMAEALVTPDTGGVDG